MNLMSGQVSYQPTQVPQSKGRSQATSEKSPATDFSAILERHKSAKSAETSRAKPPASAEKKVETKGEEPSGEVVEDQEDPLLLEQAPVAVVNENLLMAPLNIVASVEAAVPTQPATTPAVPQAEVAILQRAVVLQNPNQLGQGIQEQPPVAVISAIPNETLKPKNGDPATPKVAAEQLVASAVAGEAKATATVTDGSAQAKDQMTNPPKATSGSEETPVKQGTTLQAEVIEQPIVETKKVGAETKAEMGMPQVQTQTPAPEPVVIKVNDTSSLLQKQVYNQISDKIVAHIKDGQTTFNMTLHPERLGKIDIKLMFEAGRVVVHVETQNPLTQHLLTNNMGELKSALQNSSIPVTEVHIAQYMGDSDGGYDESKQFSGKEQNRDHQQKGLVEEEEFDAELGNLSLTETGLNYSV